MLLYDREWEKVYWNVAPFKYLPYNEVARGRLCICQTKRSKCNIRPGYTSTRAELTNTKRINEDFNANQ